MAVKNAEVHLVVEARLSFVVVENPGLRAFAQYMIQIGSKYANISVDDVLYSRQTVRNTVFDKMAECQEVIRKEVAISSQVNSVSFCTDMTTDDVNKNSFSDFTVSWMNNWSLHHAMYKCKYFHETHTAQNNPQFIDKSLSVTQQTKVPTLLQQQVPRLMLIAPATVSTLPLTRHGRR
jgi:hypothetical protein